MTTSRDAILGSCARNPLSGQQRRCTGRVARMRMNRQLPRSTCLAICRASCCTVMPALVRFAHPSTAVWSIAVEGLCRKLLCGTTVPTSRVAMLEVFMLSRILGQQGRWVDGTRNVSPMLSTCSTVLNAMCQMGLCVMATSTPRRVGWRSNANPKARVVLTALEVACRKSRHLTGSTSPRDMMLGSCTRSPISIQQPRLTSTTSTTAMAPSAPHQTSHLLRHRLNRHNHRFPRRACLLRCHRRSPHGAARMVPAAMQQAFANLALSSTPSVALTVSLASSATSATLRRRRGGAG
mmetsp:Transcript_153839/g.491726  ORF Transcript_153839/g.491726 Transcript_153839/m.491726 type:complete len:294 (+) Transcript_153839:1575-2456(+)